MTLEILPFLQVSGGCSLAESWHKNCFISGTGSRPPPVSPPERWVHSKCVIMMMKRKVFIMEQEKGLLEGVVVLDLTRVLAGP